MNCIKVFPLLGVENAPDYADDVKQEEPKQGSVRLQ